MESKYYIELEYFPEKWTAVNTEGFDFTPGDLRDAIALCDEMSASSDYEHRVVKVTTEVVHKREVSE